MEFCVWDRGAGGLLFVSLSVPFSTSNCFFLYFFIYFILYFSYLRPFFSLIFFSAPASKVFYVTWVNKLQWHFIFTWSVIGKQNNKVNFNSVFRSVPVFRCVPVFDGFSTCPCWNMFRNVVAHMFQLKVPTCNSGFNWNILRKIRLFPSIFFSFRILVCLP